MGPFRQQGPGALGPGEAAHFAVAGAWLVHEGAVLTGPHGGRGGMCGAPDGSVLLEARKLHTNCAYGAGREAVFIHSAQESCPTRLRVLYGCFSGQRWTRKATSMGVDECGLRAPTLGTLSHTEPSSGKVLSAEQKAAGGGHSRTCPLPPPSCCVSGSFLFTAEQH